MTIDDGRVLALTGAMLADGRFEFEGEEAEGMLRPANASVAIRGGDGRRSGEFAWVGNATPDPDGLWSADWPVHSIALTASVPALDRLLDFPTFAGLSDTAAFEFRGEHCAFAWLALDTPPLAERRREALLGHAESLRIEVERSANGLEFMVEARAERPRRGESAAPPITVRCTASLSFATMALAGSGLWWRANRSGLSKIWSDAPQTGPLAQALALDHYGGTPFFAGELDLGRPTPSLPGGPWIRAWVHERMLRLQPQGELEAGGLVRARTGGPELVLHNLGIASWNEILGQSDQAVLELQGSGIGELNGVTGKEVGESGPHTQPVTSLAVEIARRPEGLRFRMEGEVAPLVPPGPAYRLFGPRIRAEFLVPTAFLFARYVNLPNLYPRRQRALGRA